MKSVVLGAGGFIGGHLAKALRNEGHEVRAVDIKPISEWWQEHEHVENYAGAAFDLRTYAGCLKALKGADFIYNLAADMGGMGFIERNKALCSLSVLISASVLRASVDQDAARVFYSSSACVYSSKHQKAGLESYKLNEDMIDPIDPEDGYGWEKLYGERLARHFYEDFGLETRVARYHNVYGPYGTYEGGREKAPAALTRKSIESQRTGEPIPVWGDGSNLRSYLYVDDCVAGTFALMYSDVHEPLNIGSEEMVSVDEMLDVLADVTGHHAQRSYDINAPQGVAGRCSDNSKVKRELGWDTTYSLHDGLENLYFWLEEKI